MPLARIITTFTEESLPLQEQLRARGFEVETASPAQSFSQPADLEISLEEMTPAQALARADEIARPDDLPVYISPGSISETSRPMVVVPVMPEADPGLASLPPVAQEAVAEDPEFDPVAFAETAEFGPQYAAVEPASQADTNPEPDESVSEPVEEPVYLEEQAESSVGNQPEVAPVEEPVSLPPEVQQILPELEAAMPDMDAWEREQGPVSDWPIWQAGAIDPMELITAPPTLKIEPMPVEPPRQKVLTFRRTVFPSDRVFWKTATWAAMVALSALVLGAAVHRFSPVPARFANNTQAAADVKPVQNAPVADPVVVKPTAALKRTAAHEPRHASPLPAPRQSASPKPQMGRKSSGDNLVAEDTVVRYGAKPAPPKVQAQVKSDGIKRYTDLK